MLGLNAGPTVSPGTGRRADRLWDGGEELGDGELMLLQSTKHG